jgi:hypothetical protein
MLILFFFYIVCAISGISSLASAIVRDNKLYVICEYYFDSFELKVYELKDGPTIDIDNSAKYFGLISKLEGFDLKFIDTSNCKNSDNKLWVRAELRENVAKYGNSSYMNWVGYIDLYDMSLKSDSSFKLPTSKSFPVTGYTVNTITNGFGSALYIEGGKIYSKKDDRYSDSDSIFKYNCTTKEWIDMNYSINGRLKILAEHKSVIIYNRYLVMLGGVLENSNNDPEKSNINESILNYRSLYNFTVFDTFTSNWEIVTIKPDIFDTSVLEFQFNGFLVSANSDKILILGGAVGKNGEEYRNSYIGILDYNSKTWTWNPIHGDDGTNFKNRISNYLLIYNNQLIVISGILELLFYTLTNFLCNYL